MDNKSIEIVSDAYIENFEGEFPFKPRDLENNEQEKFDYQLLSRLQADCKYVLDIEVGENGVKLENAQFHLWAKNPEEQITKMRELYNAAPVKPEWITEEEINGYEKRFQDISDMEHGYPTRDEAIQYCLNQGTGIVNYYDTPVAELETAETTQAERDAAAKSGHEPREVSAETVDYFYEGAKEDDAMLYAVKNDMALLDLDEWQAIREATGLQLEWEDARTINNILYEGYDFTPLDIQANEKTTSIKEAILSDLSAEDESKIYEVLSKYKNNRLMPENGQEFNRRLADSLEQVMFERGEYDFAESDRVRWLDNVPEPYALADDPATLQEARSTVTQNIENALNGELQDIFAIKDYLKDQLAEMVEEDELIPTVEGYVKILEGMADNETVTISKEEYERLLNAEKELNALRNKNLNNFKEELHVTEVDEGSKWIVTVPTNDFLQKLNESFKDSPYSISDYVQEMLKAESKELSIQITEDCKMNVLLDFTDGQGVMEIQDEKMSDAIKAEITSKVFPQVEGSVEFLQVLTDYAKQYDKTLEPQEGERIVNLKDFEHFEKISKYSSEIAQQEYLLAQDVMWFARDWSVDAIDTDKQFSEYAESLEDPNAVKDIIRTIDKYNVIKSDRTSDIDSGFEAGDILDKITKLQQAQMEELRGGKFTDKECLEIAANRAVYDYDVPLVQFGRYSAFNELSYSAEQTEDYFKSILREDDKPVLLLTVDRESKSATLEFLSNDISPLHTLEIANAYAEPLEAAEVTVKYPESFKEIDFLARNIVTDFFKDGDIHRVKLNDAEETELMSRISLMGNVENCEMYIENNNMYVDFVDRNEEPRMIPLAFTERNTLKDAVMTHEKIKEMRQPKAYTLPEGMYETIKEMPADAKVENVLDEIKNGNTSFLIDENKPLSELVAKADAEAVRKKNQNEISRD